MPKRTDYEGLTLTEAVLALAEHHGAPRTRHISEDEYELLVRAAEVIDDCAPSQRAFA
jgi:hypothetical protein